MLGPGLHPPLGSQRTRQGRAGKPAAATLCAAPPVLGLILGMAAGGAGDVGKGLGLPLVCPLEGLRQSLTCLNLSVPFCPHHGALRDCAQPVFPAWLPLTVPSPIQAMAIPAPMPTFAPPVPRLTSSDTPTPSGLATFCVSAEDPPSGHPELGTLSAFLGTCGLGLLEGRVALIGFLPRAQHRVGTPMGACEG